MGWCLCLNGILNSSPPEGFVCVDVDAGVIWAVLASGHTLVTQLKID